MNLFERATRSKLRFPSLKGDLTVEQLWDLPLQSKTGFDLDSIAKHVNGQLRSVTEESFVNSGPNPARDDFQIKLDLVKHIIGAKQAENADASKAAERKRERERLLEVLAKKQDQALEGMTVEQITRKIADLS